MSTARAPGSVGAFLQAVEDRLEGSPLALLLDVDGTLAPIAPRPEDAAVPRSTRDLLRRLIALPETVVALVSGRAVTDARRMVDIPGLWIIGNHGFEIGAPNGDIAPAPAAVAYGPTMATAARALAGLEQSVPGAFVEDKRWSLAVHYRLVNPGEVATVIERTRDVAAATGLRTVDGKKVIELRPPVGIDKGTAVIELGERLSFLADDAAILLAGDDRTDEDAFQAVRARAPRAVTVRIAGETTDLNTSAEFVLALPEDLKHVLDSIMARRAAALGIS